MSTREAIVLGAGMVGVATALHLQRRGWSVTLADRQEPGRATSYGNAGIVQREAVEPYALPRDWPTLLAIAQGRSNHVHFTWRRLAHHLPALARYWWHSAPARHAVRSAAYATIIEQATAEHRPLMIEAGVDNLVRREGLRILFRDPVALDQALAKAKALRARFGIGFAALGPDELRAAEPHLRTGGAGALHWLDSWTVSDPGGLVRAYAESFVRGGGRIVRADAGTLRQAGRGWSIATPDGSVEAEAAVITLGPWSTEALRPLGYRFPMVRKRGYHRHWRAPGGVRIPLVDSDNGFVMAPMEAGLRITTGAELTGDDAPATPIQLDRAEAVARTLLDLGDPVEAEPWFGTRPCMPDMLPVVGAAPRHPNLWLNFGHGHQGFTLGPATGRLLAEMMSGEAPYLPPEPFRPSRYR